MGQGEKDLPLIRGSSLLPGSGWSGRRHVVAHHFMNRFFRNMLMFRVPVSFTFGERANLSSDRRASRLDISEHEQWAATRYAHRIAGTQERGSRQGDGTEDSQASPVIESTAGDPEAAAGDRTSELSFIAPIIVGRRSLLRY